MWAPGARLLINTLVYVQFKIFRGRTTGGYECGATWGEVGDKYMKYIQGKIKGKIPQIKWRRLRVWGAPGPRLSPRKPQSVPNLRDGTSVSNLRDGTSGCRRTREKSSDQRFTRIFTLITKMVNQNFK